MRNRMRAGLWMVVAGLIVCDFGGTAFGQEGLRSPLEIRKIDGGKESTPEYSVKGARSNVRTKDWFRVYIEYDTAPDWIDEVTFTFYVLLKSKDPKGPPYFLLQGDVTYMNIEQGRKHVADMFLHPSTIRRYGNVERIAVVARVGGRVAGMESKPSSNQRWWEQISPTPNLVLNRLQTPFAMLYFDDFEAIKVPAVSR